MDKKPRVLTKKYEIGRLLGQGTFAKVYFARSITTNQSVAIKIVDKEKIFKAGLVAQLKREISVMRMAKHPNIVQLYEVMATKNKIFFVLEYAKGGELFNKVARGRLKEDVARKYFQQLINAVDYCHSRGVYHRDIKPENLLLDENENLKVSDFGLSALAQCKHEDGLLHTTCGTPAYVSPEVIARKGYDGAKADIWSCGVVLFVMLASYLPFQDKNLIEMYRKIGKGEFKYPNWFTQEARKLLAKILDPNPDTRISIAKIKETFWFKKGLNLNKANKTEADEPSEDGQVELRNLNAFDIISLSAGFDLTRLFEDNPPKRETRFTSRQPVSVIISKLVETGKRLRLRPKKKEGGLLQFEGVKEGRKGILGIDAEIFEVGPSFYLVEMKKSSGDTLEYERMLKDNIRPALQDIVWVWQDEQDPLQNQEKAQLETTSDQQPEEEQRQQPASPPPHKISIN
ncbi:hypothetical protein ACFE04_013237 [Oxalis oulophora]